MIVKILQKSASFKAVRYNTSKVDRDRGELLLVQNFGILQGIENLRPQDYINYLEALSTRNSRIKYPQFHVAISTKGRTHSKEELSIIAQQWMQGMGYAQQPYLLIFHKDTANNHIHIVSTRVGRDGKKIADNYEKIRAYQVLNQILGEHVENTLANHLQQALSYNFSTRAQFAMLLELLGYSLTSKETVLKISKYGREQGEIDLSILDEAIASRKSNPARIQQIRAIIHRYANKYDRTLQLTAATYSSSLANFLHEKFGLQVIFHAKDGKTPYGYSVIDHTAKSVFKGSELIPLKEFVGIASPLKDKKQAATEKPHQVSLSAKAQQQFHSTNPTATHTTTHTTAMTSLPSVESQEPDDSIWFTEINISDDVDDEAIHGRKRRGRRK